MFCCIDENLLNLLESKYILSESNFNEFKRNSFSESLFWKEFIFRIFFSVLKLLYNKMCLNNAFHHCSYVYFTNDEYIIYSFINHDPKII